MQWTVILRQIRLRSVLISVGILALLWLGLALVGYGTALIKYTSESESSGSAGSGSGGSKILNEKIFPLNVSGRIASAEAGASPQFKLQTNPITFMIPPDWARGGDLPARLGQYLRPGTPVSIQAGQVNEGAWVYDLKANPGTVFQQTLLAHRMEELQGIRISTIQNHGELYRGLGIALLVAAALVTVFWRFRPAELLGKLVLLEKLYRKLRAR